MTCHTVWTLFCLQYHWSRLRELSVRTFLCVENLRTAPACIRPNDSAARPDDSAAHPDDTQCSTKASGFLSKTQIWEDYCHRLNDVDFRPDALIHKSSIAIQIQTSKRQSSWSGCASIRYGNCVRQISRPDDHPPGPNTRSLYMEITCSGRANVWTTGHHRPDAAHFRKDFQRNF
jgi:hypothetical protein